MTKPTDTTLGFYWRIWGLLLVLTVAMVAMDSSPLARSVLIPLLLLAMAVKAGFIAAYFMHLRFERLSLVLTILIGLVMVGAILFVGLAPDGISIAKMRPWS